MQQQQPLNFSFVSFFLFCCWVKSFWDAMPYMLAFVCDVIVCFQTCLRGWVSDVEAHAFGWFRSFFADVLRKSSCFSKEQTADHWTLGIWKEIGSNTLQWLMFVPGNNSQSIFNVIPKSFTSTLASLSNVYLLIPQKSNIDTKNCHI